MESKWILRDPALTVCTDKSTAKALRLFCFPPAGAGAWVFHGWEANVPPFVQVMPVELPGRNTRIKEAKPRCMQALVEDIADALIPIMGEMPFALFGHSMGAWVAFELAQELRRRGAPQPTKLYISAARAPHLTALHHDVDDVPELHVLPFGEFWANFERRYGSIPELAHAGVRKFMWPLLQADFQLIETYLPRSLEPLPCDVVAIGALSDGRYSHDQITAWERHTRGKWEQLWLPGGHRYLVEDPGPLLAFLRRDMVGAAARQRV